MRKMKHFENLHIPLWLIKDTCWMMEFKTLGIAMIIPTLIVAFIILIHSWKKKENEFWLNLAIIFWIAANSFWMVTEFIDRLDIKFYSLIPFILGMLCVIYFYLINKKVAAE